MKALILAALLSAFPGFHPRHARYVTDVLPAGYPYYPDPKVYYTGDEQLNGNMIKLEALVKRLEADIARIERIKRRK